jgi:hypothetical protein
MDKQQTRWSAALTSTLPTTSVDTSVKEIDRAE